MSRFKLFRKKLFYRAEWWARRLMGDAKPDWTMINNLFDYHEGKRKA
jgi:hypothetical protein